MIKYNEKHNALTLEREEFIDKFQKIFLKYFNSFFRKSIYKLANSFKHYVSYRTLHMTAINQQSSYM